MLIINPYIYASGAASLLLDDYPAEFALSTRLLRTAYSGALVRIRRSSDSAEKDFYPDGSNELSMSSEDGAGTSLSTWIGSDSGYVVTWYEQSGSGKSNATESTAASQPRIVNAETLDTDGGKAAIYFNGTNSQLQIIGGYSAWDLNNDLTLIGVASVPDASAAVVTFSQRTNTVKGWWVTPDSSANKYMLSFKTTADQELNLLAQQNTTDQRLYFFTSATGTLNGYYNGTQQETGVTAGGTTYIATPDFSIGRLGQQSLWYKSYQQEIIIYESDESSNRSDIETNINGYYSIY
jgi:hypothetical protein